MAVIAHYVNNDFIYREQLLDFISLDGQPTDKCMAQYVYGILKKWELSTKVMTVMTDNAPNKSIMVEHLGSLLGREIAHGQCLSQIISLGARSILKKDVQ